MKDFLILITFPIVWWGFVYYLRTKGIGLLLRHLLGFVCGFLAMATIIVILTQEETDFFGPITLLLLFGVIIQCGRQYQKTLSTGYDPSIGAIWRRFRQFRRVCEQMEAERNEAARIKNVPFDLTENANSVGVGGTAKPFTHTPQISKAVAVKIQPQVSTKSEELLTGAGVIALPDRIIFHYENAEGETAYRDVNVHMVETNANGDYYLQGYCNIAGANRTFRIDRMMGMITRYATGEMLLADAWLKRVAGTGPKRFGHTPSVAVSKKMSTSIMFTGFKKAEREVMEALAEDVGQGRSVKSR